VATGQGRDTTRLGATRDAPPVVEPPDVWWVPADRTSTRCVQPGAAKLWRPNGLQAAVLTIRSAAEGAQEQRIEWPAGRTEIDWPASVALGDRATYLLRLGNVIRPERLDVRVVPPQPTPAHATAWLAENGCAAQAGQLLQKIVSGR
jgi:hypothetical protein